MPKYNHMFGITFYVDSDKEDASDVTHEMMKDGLRDRIDNDFCTDFCEIYDTMEN